MSREPAYIYLDDLARQGPLLTPAEEQALGRRIQTGDKAAVDELVRRNLALVVRIAMKHRGLGLDMADMIQAGNIALMRAARRFNPDIGRFTTLAHITITRDMRRAITTDSGVIHIPSNGGRTEHAHRARGALSIGDDDGAIARKIAAPEPPEDPEDAAKAIRGPLQALSPRERLVIQRRFGLDDAEPWTLEQVGQAIGLTKERVRQIQAEALEKMREAMRECRA